MLIEMVGFRDPLELSRFLLDLSWPEEDEENRRVVVARGGGGVTLTVRTTMWDPKQK